MIIYIFSVISYVFLLVDYLLNVKVITFKSDVSNTTLFLVQQNK